MTIEKVLNEHQTAIVTGANSGIGAEIAKKLARKNINIIIHYLNNSIFKVSKQLKK
jgi:NAD(P)-dependent dehydrogenase (short-subunit alcohol dehydrogenase family)